jgi:excisionase family DNA binding protein
MSPEQPDPVGGLDASFISPPGEGDQLLGVAGVARLLGVSNKTVYLLARRGHLRHYRVGTRLRFSRDQVRSYLDLVEGSGG